MKTLAVGEFKTKFSSVLADIKAGRSVAVSYGKSHKALAVLLPFDQYHKSPVRKLGVLKGRGTCKISEHFSLSDEDLLKS